MKRWLLVFLMLAFSFNVYAADQNLTDKTADTTPTTDDLVYTVNDPLGTPADRKVTLDNFSKGLNASNMGSGTLAVNRGGTGAATLTDGGVLLGSGTSAITPMGVLANGSIIVGDGATDPVALVAFTSSTGDLKHEAGGLEADVNAYDGLIGITGGATFNQTGTTTQIIIFDGAGAPTSAALSSDVTMDNAGAVTISANAVALTTDTSGNYDDGDGEAGNALTGDTATAFFNAGTIEHERGGIQADISAIADGGVLVGTGAGAMGIRAAFLTAGATGFVKHELGGIEANISAIADGGMLVGTGAGTMAIRASFMTAGAAGTIKHELGGLEADVNAYAGLVGINSGSTIDVNTSAEMITAITDETGSGLLVFGTTPTIATPNITGNITAEPKHMRFNIFDPLAVQTLDTQVCLVTSIDANITITNIEVTLDASGNEVLGDLKWADAFISLAGATIINDFDTTSGVRSDSSITAGTVASGKAIYIQFDSAPHTDITQMCVDLTYDYD